MRIIEYIEIILSFLITALLLWGLRPIWNKFLSKIPSGRKFFDCKHDKEATLIFLVTIATIFLYSFEIPWAIQVGTNLALLILLIIFISIQFYQAKLRCPQCLLLYGFGIIAFCLLTYHLLQNKDQSSEKKNIEFIQKY